MRVPARRGVVARCQPKHARGEGVGAVARRATVDRDVAGLTWGELEGVHQCVESVGIAGKYSLALPKENWTPEVYWK